MSTPEEPLSERESSVQYPRLFPAFPAWSWIDLLGITIIGVLVFLASAAGVFATAMMMLARRGAKLDINTTSALGILVQALVYGLMLPYIARVLRQRSGETALTAIHWNARPAALGTGVFGGVVMAFATSWIGGRFVPKDLPINDLLNGTLNLYAFAVFAVLFAPLLEEVYFRGLLFPLLRRDIGHPAAVVLTAIPFALIHSGQLGFSWKALALVFFVGLVLTMVRARLGSVAASWAVHAAYNSTLVIGMWVATGHFRELR